MATSDSEQPRHHPTSVTFLLALGATGSVVAGAAEGAAAKLLSVPLAVVVAWLIVLASRWHREHRAFEAWGRDRVLSLWLLLACLLSLLVVLASLRS